MDNVEDGGKDRPAPGLKLSPNVEGALWMLASAGFFTLMTTLVKFLAEDYPAPLQIFYRQMFSFLTIVPLLVRKGPGVFKATRPGILFFRAAAGTLGLVLANYSFQYLDLATANALSFTRGLWIAPLALIILSERVDSVRVGASLVGFSGVMLIVGWEVGAPASFWPMAAGMGSALLFAFTIIGAKIVTRDHSVLTIMAWATVLGVVFSFFPALFFWRWPTLSDFALLALMGASAAGVQSCYVKGVQRGDASAIAPVDYIRIVFGITVGFFVFGEIPTWMSLFGAMVVVCAALFLAWREHGVSTRATARTGVPASG